MSETKTIRLAKPHKQNGVQYPAGTRLAMSVPLANWLIGQGIGIDGGPLPGPKIKTPSMRRGCCGKHW